MPKEKLKTTIKDIAKEARVSICTVSRVLNNKKYISKNTKKKVFDAVEKLEYRPNVIARSLRTKKTKTIGIIVPDISEPYIAKIVKTMEKSARKRGYTIILGCSFYELKEEEYQAEALIDKVIEGLIFFGGYDNYEHVRKIKDKRVPLVLVDRIVDIDGLPTVQYDNKNTVGSAVDYLCKLGHKKICYIGITLKNHSVLNERFKGYQEALKKNNLLFSKDMVLLDDSILLIKETNYYNMVFNFLKEKDTPTAIIGPGDIYGPVLIKAIKDSKLSVPEDISIISLGDTGVNNYLQPPLTSIDLKEELLGSSAINLLIDILEKKKIQNKKIICPTELIIRDSVKKL